jgi:hypothetical protein
MNIQLQLKPEIGKQLIAKAAEKGISVEAYLESLIENSLTSQPEKHFYFTATYEEWEAVLKDLINSPAFSQAPPLTDAAISRDSIYSREDEIL